VQRNSVSSRPEEAQPTDVAQRASQLFERFTDASKRMRAICRASLQEHLLQTYQYDADCCALYYQYLSDEQEADFPELLVVCERTLALAQWQANFNAEVRAIYAIARLILDQAVDTKAVIDICCAALPKLRGGMEAEDLYDMWCLVARAAEVLVIDGQPAFRNIEIKAYNQARQVARQSPELADVYFPEARLLVLLIGDKIGTQPTREQQTVTNLRVQKIVDDLKPLAILEWIDAEGEGVRDADMELSDTVCYISLCMIHGHVSEQFEGQATKLFSRAQNGGADTDKLALWL